MRKAPPLSDAVRYPVTATIMSMAVLVTLCWWSGFSVDVLFDDALTGEGQVWRPFTSVLPHASIYHLGFNLYWIWMFGTIIEGVLGHARTVTVLLFLALVSSLGEYAVFDGGVGLSGIGYGLFGMLWVLSRRDVRFFGAVDGNTIRVFVAWFFMCLVLTYTHVMPVGNVAHGVGAVAGAALGFAMADRRSRRIAGWSAVVVLTLGSILAATVARPWVNLSSTGGAYEASAGYNALMAGNYARAERLLRAATRYRQVDDSTWTNYGILLDKLGRHSDAIQAYGHGRAPDSPSNTTSPPPLPSGERTTFP